MSFDVLLEVRQDCSFVATFRMRAQVALVLLVHCSHMDSEVILPLALVATLRARTAVHACIRQQRQTIFTE